MPRYIAGGVTNVSHTFDPPPWDNESSMGGGNSVRETPSIDVQALLWKYKWHLVICTLAGLTLGELAYRKLGPEYLATAQILVSKSANVPVNKEGTDESFGDRAEHIALIMSPMIVGKAVETHKLNELPTLSGSETPIDDILDDLKVKRSAGQDRSFLNVLDITFKSKSPHDARSIVDAVIEAYESYLAESYQENSAEVLKLTTEAKDTLFKELQAKQQDYLEFRETAPLHWKAAAPGSDSQTATNIHQENIQAIQDQRRDNLIKRTDVVSKLKSLEEAIASEESRETLAVLVRQFMMQEGQANQPGGAAATLMAPSDSGSFEGQLLPLLLHEQKLIYDDGKGNNHPEVVNVRKGIETLTEFYRQRGIELPRRAPDGSTVGTPEVDFVAVYLRSLQQQLLALEHRDAELTTLYDKEEVLARDHSKYQVKERILRDEIDRVQGLYDVVEARLNQLLHIRPNQSYSLKVVAPTKDELMVKRHLMFLAGGVAGCIGCVGGLIYLSLLRDTTLKTLDEIRRFLPSSLLGTIPEFECAETPHADDPYASWHPALCFLHHPGSHEAEAYRSLRAALFVSLQDQHLRAVQISSPEPSDGKSTVAANLALAASQSGKNVLLIDADLRRSTQHLLFRTPHNIGLSEVLDNEIEVRNAIQSTPIANLSVLTSGRIPANPAELLSSVRWDQMMMSIRGDYDLIIVDTPPVLAVSDPCIIAPRIDGLLLVVHLFKTTKSAILKSRELLQTHHVRLLGTVANGQPDNTSDPYANLYYESYTPRRDGPAATPSMPSRALGGELQGVSAGSSADSLA